MQGSKSDAPEWCRDSGYRGTGCVNCARPGLWGGREGNHRLYPEGDRQQPPLVPRCGSWRRLTPSVRPYFRGVLTVIVDVARVEAFLVTRFGGDSRDVEQLGTGVWSQAFAFRQ